MLNPLLLLAQNETFDDPAMREAARKGGPFLGGDIGIVLGAVLLVTAIIFFWVFFIRKRPKEARGSFVVERAKKKQQQQQEANGPSGRRKRRKRRPDHPDNWARNPTLNETGGLPPVRPEDPEPPGDLPAESPEPQR